MILRISDKGMVPRGGTWIYKQPETKETIVSNDWEMLLRKIKEHRRLHNIPIGLGFEAEIESYICEHQIEMCGDTDPQIPIIPRIGVGEIVRGLKVLLAFKVAGSPLVSQEVANQRAAICAKCRYNVLFQRGCAGCSHLKPIVKSLIGDAKTPYDDELKNCGICGCFTASHVWLPMDLLDRGLTDQQRAQFKYARETYGCWKTLDSNLPPAV